MKWKQFIKDYLTFTRKERIGIIVLLFLILLVALIPSFFPSSIKQKYTSADSIWAKSMKELERKDSGNNDRISLVQSNDNYTFRFDQEKSIYKNDELKKELFYFDPNTLSIDGWKKLGLKDKTIQTIRNYLNKGGLFKKPEDIQRIYGLHPDDYKRLVPFVQISSLPHQKNLKEFVSTNANNKDQQSDKYTPAYSIIDINSADTSAFISLPGIGNKLASRIIKFREKLGGFYSIDQIGETYGLPDSTFQHIKQYFKLENTFIKKININTAKADDLKSHPYIKWNVANTIVAYRDQHGNFLKLEDIKKIALITDELYIKIVPYLSIE